jgi:hypothetical protein
MAVGEGLRSEQLRAALRDALGGRTRALEDHLSRYGGGPDPRPNLKLASAFGDEMAVWDGGPAAPLLARLSADDAAPDTPQVFLPMAAAFGWVGRLRAGQEIEQAWDALLTLAGDERQPVRHATQTALRAFAQVRDGARALLARAGDWLEAEDREMRWDAAGVVVDVLAERQTLAAAGVPAALDYLSRAIADAADAPRSAERSDARRRLLSVLPRTLSTAVAAGGEAGVAWLENECAEAKQPDVRATLSDTVVRVQQASALSGQRVRHALQGSAKPPRDPTRIRPGAGRGKASRRTR